MTSPCTSFLVWLPCLWVQRTQPLADVGMMKSGGCFPKILGLSCWPWKFEGNDPIWRLAHVFHVWGGEEKQQLLILFPKERTFELISHHFGDVQLFLRMAHWPFSVFHVPVLCATVELGEFTGPPPVTRWPVDCVAFLGKWWWAFSLKAG